MHNGLSCWKARDEVDFVKPCPLKRPWDEGLSTSSSRTHSNLRIVSTPFAVLCGQGRSLRVVLLVFTNGYFLELPNKYFRTDC